MIDRELYSAQVLSVRPGPVPRHGGPGRGRVRHQSRGRAGHAGSRRGRRGARVLGGRGRGLGQDYEDSPDTGANAAASATSSPSRAAKPSPPVPDPAAPITPSPPHPSRRGSGAAAPTARKARACSTGPVAWCRRRWAHPSGLGPLAAGPPVRSSPPSRSRRARSRSWRATCRAGPPGTTAHEDLIRIAGMRWAIEECFQTAKNEVGLDQYQVRRYDAWYRPRHPRPTRPRLPSSHRRDHPERPGSGLISLTLGEVRRLLAHLNHLPEQAHTWAWSRWRRRHQHRARTGSHYKRRTRIP